MRRKREQKQIDQRNKAEQEMVRPKYPCEVQGKRTELLGCQVYLEASGKVKKQPLKGRAISSKATGKQRSNPSTSNTQLAKKQAQQVSEKMSDGIPQATGD